MKSALAVWLGLSPLIASAQVELVPDDATLAVFAGREQKMRLVLRNPTDKPFEADVRVKLFQLSSGSAMPIGDAAAWKKLQVLPKQTVLETFTHTFPAVRAATRFQIQFAGIGKTEVTVYPDDLLKRLATLAGEKPVGVLDPDNKLKPLLKQARVEFVDCEAEPPEGKLVIVWSDARTLPELITKHVKDGMAAVWIRSQRSPAAYAVRLGGGAVVVAPSSAVASLADSPLAQLNLIRYAELALEPEALRLPLDNETRKE